MLKRDQEKRQRITKNVINQSTTEQLTEIYYGLLKAISLRSVQGMGIDEPLNEMIAEVIAEMNARKGSAQDLQHPPAA